jgi:hypothetical protein
MGVKIGFDTKIGSVGGSRRAEGKKKPGSMNRV